MKTYHLVILLNLLVYGVMMSLGGQAELRHFSTHTLLELGALYAPLVKEGQAWRMLTAMFIHITPIHLATNMIALVQVGRVLEPHYGRGRFVALYVLSGLMGSASSLAWHWSRPVASAGASGAICGLIGAGMVAGHLIGDPRSRRFRNWMAILAVLVLGIGAFVDADNASHAGGLLAGAALAWLLDRGGVAARREPSEESAGLEAIFLVVIVGAGFVLSGINRDRAQSAPELVNRGAELAQNGLDHEAIVTYQRALAMEPDNARGHFNLALAFERQQQLADAEREARRALALTPDHKEAWALLARLLVRQNRDAEAKPAFDRFLDLGGKL
jgi:rhomboid protease GluP